MMELLDLPPEIVGAIAEKSVIALGPFKAQRLRLVNSTYLSACAWPEIRVPNPH